MASDLPETHSSSHAMARCLASYMRDPEAIRVAVHSEWGDSPCVVTIRLMMAKRKRQRSLEPFRPHDGYYPADLSEKAQEANAKFLAALLRAYPERGAA